MNENYNKNIIKPNLLTGAASVVKALSTYIDALVDEKISTYLKYNMPMTISGLSEYPDFLALGATLLFAGMWLRCLK